MFSRKQIYISPSEIIKKNIETLEGGYFMHEDTLKKAQKAFFSIESIEDLIKHNLSLAGYNALRHLIHNLQNEESATTIQEEVKNWCIRHNFTASESGIGWKIYKP